MPERDKYTFMEYIQRSDFILSTCTYYLFVSVEVLRPSQPNGVMSSAVSLPNHSFTGQALSSKWLISIVHILSPEIDNCPSWISGGREWPLPETDNCPSWISGRERMTVENISWSISTNVADLAKADSEGQINLRRSWPFLLSANRIIGFYRIFECRAKARMILCACAEWSESPHFAHARRHLFALRGPTNGFLKALAVRELFATNTNPCFITVTII